MLPDDLFEQIKRRAALYLSRGGAQTHSDPIGHACVAALHAHASATFRASLGAG